MLSIFLIFLDDGKRLINIHVLRRSLLLETKRLCATKQSANILSSRAKKNLIIDESTITIKFPIVENDIRMEVKFHQ